MSDYVFPKALKTYSDGEAAKAKKKQPFDQRSRGTKDSPSGERPTTVARSSRCIFTICARHRLMMSGLSDAEEDAIDFRRLKDPQLAVVCFPSVEAARKAKLKMEHGEFDWILRKKKEREEGYFANKAATGFKADFITKKKALEHERMDDEARAGNNVKANADAPRRGTPPPSSNNEEASSQPAVHYRVDTISQALNLPDLGNDAARSMTVASSMFTQELLQRAGFEAERDGSANVTPEHLERVAPYVFLQF
ncbi:hypothetical protein AAVH_25185 [Aphelenchoides avenae]|nr:hypothetical protein AAVH_25185 [Aphelenchus avenae]